MHSIGYLSPMDLSANLAVLITVVFLFALGLTRNDLKNKIVLEMKLRRVMWASTRICAGYAVFKIAYQAYEVPGATAYSRLVSAFSMVIIAILVMTAFYVCGLLADAGIRSSDKDKNAEIQRRVDAHWGANRESRPRSLPSIPKSKG